MQILQVRNPKLCFALRSPDVHRGRAGSAIRNALRPAVAVCLLVAPVLLSAGCAVSVVPSGPEFTRANYETIYVGQEAGEVEKALGSPQKKSDDAWEYARSRPYRQEARIWFQDGRVVRKQWFNPEPSKSEGR